MKEKNSVSTPLRSGGSLVRDSRGARPSEDGRPRSATPVPPRDLDGLEKDTRAIWNLSGGHRRAGSWLKKLPWQVRVTILVTLCGPPTASLILLTVDYFEYWRDVPFNLADFLGAYFLFAIPVGYVFGAAPALLAASLYSALLTANSRRLKQPLARICVAAVCGGLASGVWFWDLIHTAWGLYGLIGALVMAGLSLGTTQPAQLLEEGRGRRAGSTKAPRLPAGRVIGLGTK